VLDLARKARIGHTAIAAGPQTLSAGLAEAWLRLGERPHMKLVLVFADLPLPGIYSQFADSDMGGIAFALRLSAGHGEGTAYCLTRDPAADGEGGPVLDAPPAERLARELVVHMDDRVPQPLRWRSQGSLWSFGKSADEAS